MQPRSTLPTAAVATAVAAATAATNRRQPPSLLWKLIVKGKLEKLTISDA